MWQYYDAPTSVSASNLRWKTERNKNIRGGTPVVHMAVVDSMLRTAFLIAVDANSRHVSGVTPTRPRVLIIRSTGLGGYNKPSCIQHRLSLFNNETALCDIPSESDEALM